MNPNRSFKLRKTPKYEPYDRFKDMMITENQSSNITWRINKRNTHWTTLTTLAIGEVKPLAHLTFYEASACLKKLKEWERLDNEPK